MFELTDHTAKIASFTPIAEKHGDENKLAASLKLELTCSNAVLDAFHKDLRTALYRKAGSGEQQDLIEGADGLVAVKFPRIGGLSWDEEFPGYELSLSGFMGIADSLDLVDVTLKKFKFEPLEGGSVALTFSAVFHPDAEEAGQLCALIQDEVELTLVPPSKQDGESEEGYQQELPEAA